MHLWLCILMLHLTERIRLLIYRQGSVFKFQENRIKVFLHLLDLMNFFGFLCVQLVVDLPHLAEVIAYLESIGVLIHLEVQLNLVHVDELRLQLLKLRVSRTKRTQEDRDTRMAFQLIEKVFNLLSHFLRVVQVRNLFLKGSLILTTHFAIIHAGTNLSSTCNHTVIINCFLVSCRCSLSRSVGTLNIISLI